MNDVRLHVAETHEWYTPPEIIRALGEFDLDPCFSASRPWDTAKKHYTKEDDGLLQEWEGRVWCNPPYGRHANDFIRKCSEHRNAIALLFARADTRAWHKYIFPVAHSIFFFEGRIQFYRGNGTPKKSTNAGAASCLVSWDEANTLAIKNSGLKGKLVLL